MNFRHITMDSSRGRTVIQQWKKEAPSLHIGWQPSRAVPRQSPALGWVWHLEFGETSNSRCKIANLRCVLRTHLNISSQDGRRWSRCLGVRRVQSPVARTLPDTRMSTCRCRTPLAIANTYPHLDWSRTTNANRFQMCSRPGASVNYICFNHAFVYTPYGVHLVRGCDGKHIGRNRHHWITRPSRHLSLSENGEL